MWMKAYVINFNAITNFCGKGFFLELPFFHKFSQIIGNKAKGRISKRVFQKKQRTPNFPKNEKKCSFFGKFGVLCFLETPVLRFALLPYYWRDIESKKSHTKKYIRKERNKPLSAINLHVDNDPTKTWIILSLKYSYLNWVLDPLSLPNVLDWGWISY